MKNIFSKNNIRYYVFFLFILSLTANAQVVVIDPGHGYASNGITDPDGRTDTEHATALSVGLKLRSKLQNGCGNWTVRMTRTTRNGWISLTQRRTMSNSWNADRFISIHCNGGGGSGTETFWCNRSNSKDADNSRFSREVQNRMVEKGQWKDRRSVEDASYIFHLGVLTSNNAIGVLNEIGFVDSSDKSKLLSDSWRNKFADAYVAALENSIGNCSGGGGGGSDTTAPTTSISASGGNTQSGDFTANFSDNDNVGVTRRFYQALEKYGDNWYANRGNGFFNDNFNVLYSGYTTGAGNWNINNKHLRQSNTSSDNTKLSTYLSQNSGLPYLYEFSAKTISTSGPRKFGIHIMASDATQSQRGNSYLIWFSGEDNKVRIYETINNVLNFRAIADVSLDNNWANYKITYSPGFGVLEVFKNNRSILKWTDSSPIKNGSTISLRTNKTVVEFDDLKVYKFRATGTQGISAGIAVTKDIRRRNGKVKSLVRDAVGNWSTPGNLDVTISSLTKENPNLLNDTYIETNEISIYPNPTNGKNLNISYQATSNESTLIQIIDISGKILKSIEDKVKETGPRNLNLGEYVSSIPNGNYFIKVRKGKNTNVFQIIKK
ncbi:N-acetylmuramoyl-L-alanine amidase [uncultured Aquimarina sp.]|uniref:N-acetylmuramoyl-L-alanine amidase n=1 Tax=uncultured Aquimarina sp. TaxID=575652 RepID=UPI00260BB6AD|nr:N-acetylmuramoyl-L-alanine amidase [uncultured Aquimarina sp.]